ncbi:hypothetical protein [Nocardia sp. CDC160]|uniref:hypothetical protein n=1 Tax=Nocardia sp. CDC160 TaxID=3112166 RepID=UPI002DBD91F9|nr:hypothetical protein [Nocardia sp. CDC160]MEC3920313.1 hypothetical protein [Nocardia sp. CDC160]
MSIIVEFFIAPDDHAAASVVDEGPDGVFPTMTCGNFLADIAVTDWESILLGTDADGASSGGPRVVAMPDLDSILQVFALSPQLQTALADIDRDAVDTVAHQWIAEYGQKYLGFEPDKASEILWELTAMARSANTQKQSLYCWIG